MEPLGKAFQSTSLSIQQQLTSRFTQFHVFGSALCLGTLVLRDPSNVMASLILSQIDTAVNLFTSLIQHGAGNPRYHRNLQWLLKLKSRVSSKISAAYNSRREQPNEGSSEDTKDEGDDVEGEDVELLGWRTRLVERAGQDRKTIRTIKLGATPAGASDITDMSQQRRNNNDHGLSESIQGFSETMLPLVTPGDIVSSTSEMIIMRI